ncbi:CHAT domain-containing protein [Oxynema sp. CENA135]|uniref:CHAT domain-containing protein n=1 Tax=Oxynema sp. CENA135 TaxID=984206 RepID=UPI00190CE711|nr:CHAT domain-containing protein [Oxynema sp. CENA135]
MSSRVTHHRWLWTLPICLTILGAGPGRTQTPIPAADGTGTVVTPDGNRFDIDGGRRSPDGANLFHSFEQFGLDPGQTANFLSDPQIRNILTRVVGGDPSVIHGLLQVSGGNSNLYLLNPAGIVFGSQARLDVPASFFATTATGIGFEGGWFDVSQAPVFDRLLGSPNAFAFDRDRPGVTLNAGHLAVTPGATLSLSGATVINTGTLSAPGGQISLAAVPGEGIVRLSQTGMVLSLDLDAQGAANPLLTPPDLAELLTGGQLSHATGVRLNPDGTVSLSGSTAKITPEAGMTIASGHLSVAHTQRTIAPGAIQVLGDRVGVLDAAIDASSIAGGGDIWIGGDLRGGGTLPTARQSAIGSNSTVKANAIAGADSSGNGGRIIIWADDLTRFSGTVEARGVGKGGNGGFVEISGKERLIFNGSADLSAPEGLWGTLLLDPRNIAIVSGDSSPGVDEALSQEPPQILADDFFGTEEDGENQDIDISASTLEQLSGNIILEATNDITIANNVDLTFVPGGSIVFTADADQSGEGAFSMSQNSEINTQGRDLTISGVSVEVGIINTALEDADAGNLSLIGSSGNVTARELIATATGDNSGGEISLSTTGSGEISLQASGAIDTSAADGDAGTITLSTENGVINIANNDLTATSNNGSGGAILLETTGDGAIDINPGVLNSSSQAGDGGAITLRTGNGDIRTRDLTSNSSGAGTGGAIAVSAGGDGAIEVITGTFDSSSLSGIGGDISLDSEGGDIKTGELLAGSEEGVAGAIAIDANTGTIDVAGDVIASDLSLIANAIALSGGANSVTGTGQVSFQPPQGDRDIEVGTTASNSDALQLSGNTLSAIASGFEQIAIGTADSTADVRLGTSDPFNLPVLIRGGDTLFGGDRDTTWTLSGVNSGTVSGYANGLRFENIENLVAGNRNDLFVFNDGARLSGTIDGRDGNDYLNYDAYTTPVNIDLPSNTATGTAGVFNIEEPPTPNTPGNGNSGNETPDNETPDNETPDNETPDNETPEPTIPIPPPIEIEPAPDIAPLSETEDSSSDSPIDNDGTPPQRADFPVALDREIDPTIGSQAPNPVSPEPMEGVSVPPVPETSPLPERATGDRPDNGSIPEIGGIDPNAPIPVDALLPLPSNPNPAPENPAQPPPNNPVAQPPIAQGPNAVQPEQILQVDPSYPSGSTQGNSWGDREMGDRGVLGDRVNNNLNNRPVLRLATRSEIENLFDRGDIPGAIETLDRFYSEEFESFLGVKTTNPYLSFPAMQLRQQEMAELTGDRSAIIYTFVRSDYLEVVLVPLVGDPIYKRIVEAPKIRLLQEVRTFLDRIVSPIQRRTDRYLEPSQQLYNWMLAPLADDLERLEIDTLIFSMDEHLRSLPLAALHDGNAFLVERYNLSLIPSLHLVDTRYQSLNNASILAMGVSQFQDQPPLPAVPLEISTIAENIWPGKTFLNQAVTLENLKEQRQEFPYQIIHLATHGQFSKGQIQESYLQLWDKKLRLDHIPALPWHDPPVELLVLSACRTALGDREAEFGFAGLAVQSGAKSAIASLWYANDTGTLGLMSEFYHSLRSVPLKAQALREAQIAMLRGELYLKDGQLVGSFGTISLPPEFSGSHLKTLVHPYYWAGFTTIGSPW